MRTAAVLHDTHRGLLGVVSRRNEMRESQGPQQLADGQDVAAVPKASRVGRRNTPVAEPNPKPIYNFDAISRQVAKNFMVDGVAGCEALVCALLSVEPDVPNANDLILRAAVATSTLAEDASIR